MSIQFTRIKNDVYGNPRYVCHFLNLNTTREDSQEFWNKHGLYTMSVQYALAVTRSHKIGGRKYHTKGYGGGIVFQSYSLQQTEQDILRVVAEAESEQAKKED